MKGITKIAVILTLVFGSIFLSCQKFDEYPLEPQITFDSFTLFVDTIVENDTMKVVTNRGVLAFFYTDGDGDLGLRSNDTLPPFNQGSPYYYNIIVHYYEKQDGEFVEVPIIDPDGNSTIINFNGRFPYLTPAGIHKAIKGVIQDTLPVNNPNSKYDTIKFRVYIYDRALNKSNEIETPEIPILKEVPVTF